MNLERTSDQGPSRSPLILGEVVLSLLAGILLFFCLYRVAIVRPAFVLNLLVGGVGLLLLIYTPIMQFLWSDRRWRRLFICAVALATYVLALDWYSVESGVSIRSSFFLRLVMLMLMSFCCALALVHLVLRGRLRRLRRALFICVSIQLSFFFLLFSSPDLKFPVYAIFGMSSSPNLYEWNLYTRGFGVGTELNYTAPIVTAIISILFFRSAIYKMVVIVSQIANTTLTIFSLAFFVRQFFIAALAVCAFWFLYTSIPEFADVLGAVLPRFSNELVSGFAVTAEELLSRHMIYDGRSVADLLFGTGVNLLPEVGKERSSDIGWVIMLNYGGVTLILLFVLFIFASVAITPFNVITKTILVGCALVLNTKGLVLGPNAFFFFMYLVALNSLRASKVDRAGEGDGGLPRLAVPRSFQPNLDVHVGK